MDWDSMSSEELQSYVDRHPDVEPAIVLEVATVCSAGIPASYETAHEHVFSGSCDWCPTAYQNRVTVLGRSINGVIFT